MQKCAKLRSLALFILRGFAFSGLAYVGDMKWALICKAPQPEFEKRKLMTVRETNSHGSPLVITSKGNA